jgi:cell wall assembly regulator SMI1
MTIGVEYLLIVLVLGVLGVLALRSLQRAMFYPHPRVRVQAVESGIGEAIQDFERVLAKDAQAILSGLQPGLAENEITKIEKAYGFRLTDDLRSLYRWRNGTPEESKADLIPGHRFLPLEEAAVRRREIRSQIGSVTLVQRLLYSAFAGHRTNWLPVLDDRFGDGYFYDPERRRQYGSFFYHFTEDRSYRFFPSVADFLIGAAECYETGAFRCRSSGRSDENHEKSFEIWAKYAS